MTSAIQHHRHHGVQFYGSEYSLFVTVSRFLGEGLLTGHPAIVIATKPHRAGILEHLGQRHVDWEQAVRDGDLVLLDAEETLDLFMVDEQPHGELFEANVGRLIEQTWDDRRLVIRAYGEMVDVLWKQNRTQAAMALEMLWNKLAYRLRFTLLCGYAMGSFFKQSDQIDEIAALHTRVVPSEGQIVPFRRRTATPVLERSGT
jgi:KaiC/GvpD/RAD55 family RecA-like ATPase